VDPQGSYSVSASESGVRRLSTDGTVALWSICRRLLLSSGLAQQLLLDVSFGRRIGSNQSHVPQVCGVRNVVLGVQTPGTILEEAVFSMIHIIIIDTIVIDAQWSIQRRFKPPFMWT